MRVVLQRVSQAEVSIGGQKKAEIAQGFLLLVGIHQEDTEKDVSYLANKISKLRVFEDSEDKMNLSIQDIKGSILSVSQFTLYAQTKKGNRPSFIEAGEPERANQLYEKFNQELRDLGSPVMTGEFGAHMEVSLVNDGPVTIILDTKNQ